MSKKHIMTAAERAKYAEDFERDQKSRAAHEAHYGGRLITQKVPGEAERRTRLIVVPQPLPQLREGR